jgi:DNA-binding XRE family transcriptional regulator
MSNRVREIRKTLGLTQQRLARKAGVSPRTIHSAEHGGDCTIPTKRKILRALGLPFAERADVFPEEQP